MNDLKIAELVVAVAASNFEPSLLQLNTLKYSGTVPQEWERLRQPVTNPNASQVIFKNGIQILAQPGRCLFVEPLGQQNTPELTVLDIAKRYISTLPNLAYEAVGINVRGYIPFDKDDYSPDFYIKQHLLKSGDWWDDNASAVHSEIKLAYVYEDHRLTLTINSGSVQNPDESPLSVLLFGGTFEYSLEHEQTEEKSIRLQKILADGDKDLQAFRDVISKFPELRPAEAAI